MGYNYEWNDLIKIPMPKQILYDIEKKYYLEVAIIALFDFSESLIQKMTGGNKNE